MGNAAANSAITYLQIAFNKAQYEFDDNGFPPDALNPIRKGFPWFPDASNRRERLATGDASKPNQSNDIPAWWDETERTLNKVEKQVWRLFLFTGFRNSDCCKIKWSEIENIDNDATAVMYRPEPKGGRLKAFKVPLSTPALAILRERRAEQLASENPRVVKSPYVFETFNRKGELTHVDKVDNQETVQGKKVANKVLKHPHAIRRTFQTALKKADVEKQDRMALMNHSYPVKSAETHDGYDEPETEFLRPKVQAAADFLMGRGRLHIVNGKLLKSNMKIAAA